MVASWYVRFQTPISPTPYRSLSQGKGVMNTYWLADRKPESDPKVISYLKLLEEEREKLASGMSTGGGSENWEKISQSRASSAMSRGSSARRRGSQLKGGSVHLGAPDRPTKEEYRHKWGGGATPVAFEPPALSANHGLFSLVRAPSKNLALM